MGSYPERSGTHVDKTEQGMPGYSEQVVPKISEQVVPNGDEEIIVFEWNLKRLRSRSNLCQKSGIAHEYDFFMGWNFSEQFVPKRRILEAS